MNICNRNFCYDPVSARFFQKDPIGLAAGDTNLYRYVENSPIAFKDPLGLEIDGPIYSMSTFIKLMNTPTGQGALNSGFKDSNLRYVYTNDGVVDMRHVQAAFNQTRDFYNLGVPYSVAASATYSLGLGVEFSQALGMGTPSYGQPRSSAFSSEDIPSNAYGIKGAKDFSNFNSLINNAPEATLCRPYE